MINHYLANGEDDELRDAGIEIYRTWPRLVELSDAARDAKEAVRQRWEKAAASD